MARLSLVLLTIAAVFAACGSAEKTDPPTASQQPTQEAPESRAMGGQKSVMTFFVTSKGPGKGGDLGGLAGADAHCAALAKAEGAGDHTWRAYLSASAMDGQPAVNARDRIGKGPWYNAEGLLVAANMDELHSDMNRINKEMATTERLDPVNGVGDNPNMHDILTGSRADGTAFPAGENLTCRNWMSSTDGRAQVGHHDRRGRDAGVNSWNSVHPSSGCGQSELQSTGGAGLFYCFGID
jgi:hypothetical protein